MEGMVANGVRIHIRANPGEYGVENGAS